jgi:hypothetical protein
MEYVSCLNDLLIGPIVGLNLGGKNVIILNTHKVCADLLDKRASIYSDRSLLFIGDQLMY